MLHKTRGVVLSSLNYNDTYFIASILTEEFGTISYFVPKAKGRKAKVPKSLFHSLAILDLEVEHQNLRSIQKLKEAKIHTPLFSVLSNPVKSTISIFLSEFISKVVKEIQPNQFLFDYILQSIQILELSDKMNANFHLVFMIQLSRFLGFHPNTSDYKKGLFFDMQNGIFAQYKPSHSHFLNPDESRTFALLLRMSYENMSTFRFSRNERRSIIYKILEYYRLHLIDFSDIKSLEILHEVFG